MTIDIIATILSVVVLLLALPVTFAGYKLQVLTGAVSSFFAAALWCKLIIAGFMRSSFLTLLIGIIAAVVAARIHVVGRFGTVALAVLLITEAVVASIYTYYALAIVIVSVVTITIAYLSYNSRKALILSSAFSGAALLAGAVAILTATTDRAFDRYERSFEMDSDGTMVILVLALAFLGGLVVQFRFTAPLDTPPAPTLASEETPRTAPYAAV
ncbi:hypothetical protein SDRG_03696 [Saprolegnia diclina VS20]|uniref:DUF4203 domain-containing protein n=1 Tax=Saprolegnia diclina (strain VS20) TaxID=1156394 RepID=T0QVM3_SAPDV|nr:hypothetical protein SDRG_03696 [Saprolegnia diclina VS20]EQC38731.1 hypothetical protein SDRG_03696 [Saprolegnia diclina VS20]|eukprot:XP_008607555.1 hypothetical protein SDRG_03696 [Saprolegnia diclina VS20]